MALIYAGIPLTPEAPSSEWATWVRQNIKLKHVYPLDRFSGGLTQTGAYNPEYDVLPYVLQWPVGATRWAQFHAIVSERQLGLIRSAVGEYSAQTLQITWYDADSNLKAVVAPLMYMLPAKPLLQLAPGIARVMDNISEGMYLLTLVDQRYFLWSQIAQRLLATSTTADTWANTFAALVTLLQITCTVDTVATPYGFPTVLPLDLADYVPPILDLCAFNFGHRFVANLAGTFKTQTPDTARAAVTTNLQLATAQSLRAGGWFSSLAPDVNYVAETVKVLYPISDPDSDDVYTDTYTNTIGNAIQPKVLYSTYQAVPPLSAPANLATINTITAQMAADYLAWSTLEVDEKFNGIVPFTPEAFHDIEWTYHEAEVSTRLIPYQYESLFVPNCCKKPKPIRGPRGRRGEPGRHGYPIPGKKGDTGSPGYPIPGQDGARGRRGYPGAKGATGGLGSTGPRGLRGKLSEARKHYLIQGGGGRDVSVGVYYPGNADIYGGHTIVWANAISTEYANLAMWASSPNPTRITIPETGKYRVTVWVRLWGGFDGSVNNDWTYFYLETYRNGAVPPSPDLIWADYWWFSPYATSTAVTVNGPLTADFPHTLQLEYEKYYTAGDYLRTYVTTSFNYGASISTVDDAYMWVRKIDKAG